MSFKLIAIRPTAGISSKYLKNLIAGEVYNLCNDYTLLNDRNLTVSKIDKVTSIVYNKTLPDNIYSLKNVKGIPQINITAIVGKNGSGKSSLIDLLLLSIFSVSYQLNYIDPDKFIDDNQNPRSVEKKRYELELKEIKSGLKVELYYLIDNRYYQLIISKGECRLQSYTCDAKTKFSSETITKNDYIRFNHFFYTIVVNYSLYAFNSNYTGLWLKAFFHKNDGYKMPIVINPFRENGNIDVNTETVLTRSRLLSNILTIPDYKIINQKSEIGQIQLYFDPKKNYKHLTNGKLRFRPQFIKRFRDLILSPLFSKMFGSTSSYPVINTTVKRRAEIYLINKLITIPSRYEAFEEFDNPITLGKERQDNYNLTVKSSKEYVQKIYQDRSHITLKVRQTLNFLREDIYNLPSDVKFGKTFNVNSVMKNMNRLKSQDWFTEIIDYLPPPFMFSRIKFKDGSYFEDLSSGEKQRIYSLNSVIYHVRNLDSISKSFKNQALPSNGSSENNPLFASAYHSINLIFDEVELYYHPQFQKETVSSLLFLLKNAKFSTIKNINIIFLTHSPFILSDIPIQNTALLAIDKKTGTSELIKDKGQSFGGNIHDLLANNFFLTDTLIGDFADKKIIELIKKIKKGTVSADDELLLQLIGDTFLKTSIEKFWNSDDKN